MPLQLNYKDTSVTPFSKDGKNVYEFRAGDYKPQREEDVVIKGKHLCMNCMSNEVYAKLPYCEDCVIVLRKELNKDVEQIEGLNEKNIIKWLSEQEDIIPITKLKLIQVTGNKIIKTKVRTEAFETGINLIKGWKAECPKCKTSKTIYNNYIKNTQSFEKDPCVETGSRGGQSYVEIVKKPINDTGYSAEGYDVNESGSSATPYSLFFSLDVLPTDVKELKEFELDLLRREVEVTGIIRVKQGREKNITEWFIDVQSYSFLDKDYHFDEELLLSLKDVKKDNDFFNNYFAPAILGKELQKKCQAITLLSPFKVILPNGNEEYANTHIVELGDQGTSKTTLVEKGFLPYTEGKLISAENASIKGLTVKTIKSKSGNKWISSLGELPKQNRGAVVLDGMGRLSPEDQSELRGLQAERKVQSNKVAGNFEAECALAFVGLGNLLKPVASYTNKHRASYDLAITTGDRANRFSGADRRRQDHILIISNEDISTSQVHKHLLIKKENNFDDIKYWNNLNNFVWSRKPDQFKWDEDIISYLLEKIGDLNKRYSEFELEYGILGKGGSLMFTKQLPAVAALHGSIEGENVEIKKEHVDWLHELYLEEFRELGLDVELGLTEFYNSHAKKILEKCSQPIRDALYQLNLYGSQRALERSKVMSRMTIYRLFKNPIDYEVEYEGEGKKNCYYSLQNGSQVKTGEYQYLEDGILDPLNKADGTLTTFGKILINMNKDMGNPSQVKKIVEVKE